MKYQQVRPMYRLAQSKLLSHLRGPLYATPDSIIKQTSFARYIKRIVAEDKSILQTAPLVSPASAQRTPAWRSRY